MGESAGLLRLTVKQEGAQDELEGIEYECDSLDHQGWASLIQTCIEEKLSSLTFLISKRILQEASVYFRCLLSGDFRESAERNVCVTWDPSVFCYLLQFICTRKLDGGCDLESFLNAIMFFGVEVGTVTVMEKMNEIGLVELAPNLWTTANGFGDHLVAEACIKTFVINFEDAMRRMESENLPADFVAACLQHEQLTVSSERSLCDALLNWFRTMQKDQVYIVDGVLNKTVHSILRKVKVLLLPVEFVLGILVPSLPAKVFSVKETDLIEFNQLFHFEETSQMSVQQIQDSYSNDLAIRLSGHLRILDLAGCQQVTVAVLFHSLLQYLKQNSNNDLTLYEKLEAEIYSIFVHGSVTHSPMNQEFFTMTSLKNVCEINFQGCWRLDQNRLVHWLHVACPNLKVLNISQCPQLNVDILPQILKGCKYVEVLNASLNILRTQVELSSDRISMHIFNQDSCKYEGYLCSLTNLSFEGRNHLKDSDLYLLTRYCINLSTINFGGCSQLTDKGLSIFLSSIRNLTKLQVPYTAFGRLSVNAVLGLSCEQHSDELWSDKIQSDFYTRECALATLDLEGCLNIDRDSISQLIKEAPLLENLNLGFLSLDDSTLLCFSGTSLNNLNLQETQVTEYGIAHILKWNQHLNSLNIRGCKKITSALAFKISDTIRKQDALNIGMAETSTLKCLAAGWGFTDSTFMALKPSLRHLQSFSLGLGSRISECVLSNLHEFLPQLEDLSLVFQAISGSCMLDLLKHGQALKRLELCHCFVELSHEIIHVMPTGLTSLRLERGIEWMTDADIELLVSKHQTLTSLYLTGCKNLTPRSLETISKSWQAMTYLTLKECGTMTLNGGGCLFVCKALKHLTLQHSGAGLDKDFVKCALVEVTFE